MCNVENVGKVYDCFRWRVSWAWNVVLWWLINLQLGFMAVSDQVVSMFRWTKIFYVKNTENLQKSDKNDSILSYHLKLVLSSSTLRYTSLLLVEYKRIPKLITRCSKIKNLLWEFFVVARFKFGTCISLS